ncbi:chromatin remodeling protein SHL-like isoform X2 [Cornus florida]|uniref:chromatin remodeling protein SHL-like isoform X2 n=1 Tax=Cornus florida TaxID=4283 RepID=UPI00289E1F89|nr:chromatin remodeling protein SHL-like isoform X2 [Cornus florida]
MAKARATRRTLDSYTVKSINKTIRAGDCVLMRPSDPGKPSYVAKLEKIESDSRGANVKIHVRWYYRPEESIGGRRQFHGSKELFLSDHYDVQSADTIEGKCTVHSFKSYTKLDAVGNDDFFCRFEYNSSTGAFNPDRVAVYCKCEMPYNPDDLMVQCEGCTDWSYFEYAVFMEANDCSQSGGTTDCANSKGRSGVRASMEVSPHMYRHDP